jgi:tRNA 2-thiouridine synthesizing protein C
MNAKRIILSCRKAPYGDALAREALDVALAAGVFEQDLALVFMGDGVWQLLNQQDSQAINSKSIEKLLGAFPLYGINEIYVDKEALFARNIDENRLSCSTTLVTPTELSGLFESADIILNF